MSVKERKRLEVLSLWEAKRWLACSAVVDQNADRFACLHSSWKPAPMLAHNVYFALHDPTPANVAKLVAACHKYLAKHPGTVFYAAGTLSDLNREVNDRGWHVGLHVIFQDRAAHDAYQVHPEHLKFIEENKAGWKNVRVFDTDAAAS